MTEPGQNIEIYRGDTVNLNVTVYTDAGHTIPANLNGCTITWYLYKSNLIPSVITKTNALGGGITVTNAAAGKFTVALISTNTSGIYGTYYHLTKMIDASTNVSTLFIGSFTIHAGKLS
jgi:hypothetical protein